MSVMEIVLLLACAWLMANVTLVFMLRRNVRVRERELGRAPRTPESVPISRAPLGDALSRP